MKGREIIILVLGIISIGCVNALAFVYDSGWIDVAIALDSAFIGAIISNYISTKNNKENTS